MFWNGRRRLHRILCRVLLGVHVLAFWTIAPHAQGADPWKPNDNSFEGFMAREPMRRDAEALALKFVEAAVAKNRPELLGMLSPESVAAVGQGNAEIYLDQSVIPFFASHKEFGRSTTVSTARDANGNIGFAFYRYSVRDDGEKKPFVIFVLRNGDRWHVANILVDHFVPDRHRPGEQ